MVSSASEAVDKEPGRRHGDGEQRPASQPLGQKYPHAQCPLFRPAEPGLLCRLGGDSQWTAQRARRITAWQICFALPAVRLFPGTPLPIVRRCNHRADGWLHLRNQRVVWPRGVSGVH